MRSITCFLFLLFIFSSCKNDDKEKEARAENDIDAAREFIRAALDGKFDRAKNYLLQDSVNIQFMNAHERNYNDRLDQDTKNGYRSASINIHKVEPLNDSSTIVVYSNSLKNDHDSLKVVRVNGKWLVDLKYLFRLQVDSLPD